MREHEISIIHTVARARRTLRVLLEADALHPVDVRPTPLHFGLAAALAAFALAAVLAASLSIRLGGSC